MPHTADSNFEIFPWDDNFNTGIDIIDNQHKRLVSILNQLATHYANTSSPIILNSIYDELADYAAYHFTTEDGVWIKYFGDDEWLVKHDKVHDTFLEKLAQIKSNKDNRPIDDVIYDIVSFLAHWLAYHILDNDKRMAKAALAIEAGLSTRDAKNHADDEMAGSLRVLINTVLTMYDRLSSNTLELMREKSLRIKAEEALLASEKKWQFIVEDKRNSIWDWDLSDDSYKQSDAAASIFDLALLNSRDPVDPYNIHPSDIARVKANLNAHLQGETEFFIDSHRILRSNGSWGWVQTRGKVVDRDNHGLPLRMVGVQTDTTERELASMIYNYSLQAMCVCDLNHIIIDTNPAFTRIAGFAADELIGKPVTNLLSTQNTTKDISDITSAFSTFKAWKGELHQVNKAGNDYPTEMSVIPVTGDNGEVDHFIVMFSDITEKKQAEDTLRHSQKMDAIGQLTAGISHDFNNILGVILGNIELLEIQTKQDLELHKRTAVIKKAGRRATELVRQLLQFSRKQPKNPSVTNINSTIINMDTLITRALTPEVQVIHDFEESPWTTCIDAGDFEDALLNMMLNARDAMNGKGTIVLTTRNVVIDNSYFTDKAHISPGDYLLIQVSDTGTGIHPDVIEHIFEPFFSTKPVGKGTGLGLAMVYAFVKRSSGYITVTSEPNRGTTFNIYLPRAQQQPNQAQDSNPDGQPSYMGHEALLVVDDEPALTGLAKEILEGAGYRVSTANDSQQALNILGERNDIALLFSDVIMPGELNGFELAEQARRIRPDIKVLLTSGYSGKGTANAYQETLQSQLLKKPYTTMELLNKIRITLDTASQE